MAALQREELETQVQQAIAALTLDKRGETGTAPHGGSSVCAGIDERGRLSSTTAACSDRVPVVYCRAGTVGGTMSELPKMLIRGERARLFPVLADTSKEGRSLSIFLACLANVDEFGRGMLSAIGVRVGARAKIETYTEVVFQKAGEKASRPDGLIIVRSGSSEWTAMIEAKVGNTDLTADQVESYLEVAKQNGVSTLITVSNQFAPLPTHHPIALPAAVRRKANIFHWSWMFVLTEATPWRPLRPATKLHH